MIFRTRKMIKPEDLNPRGSLFGGKLLAWIDEEAAIYAICQLETKNVVTKFISEVNFISPAFKCDIIEIGIDVVSFGNTSITLKCVVRNKDTKNEIVRIDKIVFVAVDYLGLPYPHGKTELKFYRIE